LYFSNYKKVERYKLENGKVE